MNVIIIGASSGIGWELAKKFSKEGHTLGLTARRTEKLQELQKELNTKSFIKFTDLTKAEEAVENIK